MHRYSTVMLAAVMAGAGSIALAAQSTSGQSTTPQAATKAAQGKQVTLTGCLRQTSDDPRVFALVSSDKMATSTGSTAKPTGTTQKPTGTTGSAMTAPLYRLEDKGQNLKQHVGQRVEVTGTVTPAKDEKEADIVMSRRENIGVDTVTVTTIDLKPAPRLDVTSARKVSGECPSAPAADKEAATAGTSGTAEAPRTATIGEISENPDRFIGQTVTVTGEVETVFGPRVFSLDEDRVLSTGVDVLVLSRTPGAGKDNQQVTVTGEVRKFVRAELQREIIDFDLEPEWLVDFESRPAIFATKVTPAKQ